MIAKTLNHLSKTLESCDLFRSGNFCSLMFIGSVSGAPSALLCLLRVHFKRYEAETSSSLFDSRLRSRRSNCAEVRG